MTQSMRKEKVETERERMMSLFKIGLEIWPYTTSPTKPSLLQREGGTDLDITLSPEANRLLAEEIERHVVRPLSLGLWQVDQIVAWFGTCSKWL